MRISVEVHLQQKVLIKQENTDL